MKIETRLSDVLSEFARTVVTDFPIQAILDHLVGRIVEVLPISAAGVTLISPGVSPRYVAASNASALRYEQLQSELSEGPCVVAYQTGVPVLVPDLAHDDRFPRFTPRALEEGLRAVFTIPLRQGDRPLGALDLYRTTVGALNDEETAAAQTLADVTSAYLVNAEARANLRESVELSLKSALHDPLTGLPNRTLLRQRLDEVLTRSRASGQTAAILFVDLDDFKRVNDTYGHHIGDQLLIGVGKRLRGLLRPSDTVARLAGDEFVMVAEQPVGSTWIYSMAPRVIGALAEVFVLSGIRVQVGASVGIAVADSPYLSALSADELMQEADSAMYRAKGSDRATRQSALGATESDWTSPRQATLARELRSATEDGQLRVEYQPIVTLPGGAIICAEALLRWDHPRLGQISSVRTSAIAEDAGLIGEIGLWVLARACADLCEWRADAKNPELMVSVNVSAHQLMNDDFPKAVAAVLAAADTDPGGIMLELTERVLIHDSERALNVLTDLKRRGISLALDAFGTGFSSLAHLKDYPIDTVKLDRAFVATLGGSPASRIIIEAVVGLGHALGMSVVAEGVETAEQFDIVAELKCDAYQGLYFARPMSVGQLAALSAV